MTPLQPSADNPSRGDEAQRDRLVAVFRTMLKSSEPTTDADTDEDCTILPMPVEDFDRTMRIAIAALHAAALHAAALPAVPEVCGRCKGRGVVDDNVDADDCGGSIGTIESCPVCVNTPAATPAHDQPEGSDNG